MDGVCSLRLGREKHCRFSLLESFLEEASCYVMKTLKKPFGEVHVVRNGGLLTTAKTNLPAILGVGPSASVKPSNDCRSC